MWQKIFHCLTLSLALLLASCGFHLRNQHVVPPLFHCLKIESTTPYGGFESTLRRTLATLGVNVTRTGHAPVIFHVIASSFYNDVPTIGGSNQARVYVYYYRVDFQVFDEQHVALTPPLSVATSKSLIINAGTALESTSQVEVLRQEMYLETAHMALNVLNSPKLFSQ